MESVPFRTVGTVMFVPSAVPHPIRLYIAMLIRGCGQPRKVKKRRSRRGRGAKFTPLPPCGQYKLNLPTSINVSVDFVLAVPAGHTNL